MLRKLLNKRDRRVTPVRCYHSKLLSLLPINANEQEENGLQGQWQECFDSGTSFCRREDLEKFSAIVNVNVKEEPVHTHKVEIYPELASSKTPREEVNFTEVPMRAQYCVSTSLSFDFKWPSDFLQFIRLSCADSAQFSQPVELMSCFATRHQYGNKLHFLFVCGDYSSPQLFLKK